MGLVAGGVVVVVAIRRIVVIRLIVTLTSLHKPPIRLNPLIHLHRTHNLLVNRRLLILQRLVHLRSRRVVIMRIVKHSMFRLPLMTLPHTRATGSHDVWLQEHHLGLVSAVVGCFEVSLG